MQKFSSFVHELNTDKDTAAAVIKGLPHFHFVQTVRRIPERQNSHPLVNVRSCKTLLNAVQILEYKPAWYVRRDKISHLLKQVAAFTAKIPTLTTNGGAKVRAAPRFVIFHLNKL